MNIGLLCYASVGGSGIVATELGKALADRGHDVHFISADPPFRLTAFQPGLAFHQVQTPSYPLFREPQYMLSLANRVVQVARQVRLAVVHAHYAVPHATVALLARQVLAATGAVAAPKVMTTLHGTDMTLVGSDPSFSERCRMPLGVRRNDPEYRECSPTTRSATTFASKPRPDRRRW